MLVFSFSLRSIWTEYYFIVTSLSDIYLMCVCLSQWVSIYAYRCSGHQVKSLTVAFPSYDFLVICSHAHTHSRLLITLFEIKVSKSKSDLGHFFNNVRLCVYTFHYPHPALCLFIQLSTCRESGQIMKNQHK